MISLQDSCICTNTNLRTGNEHFVLSNTPRDKLTTTVSKPQAGNWFSVASWNNILVLPECPLQTPASVILLQAGTTSPPEQLKAPPSLEHLRQTGLDICVCFQSDHLRLITSVCIFTCRASKYLCPSLKKYEPTAMFQACLVCLYIMKRCNSCLLATSPHTTLCVTSDLALRNCLLTADVSVKIGDYGLSHTKYKVDRLPGKTQNNDRKYFKL